MGEPGSSFMVDEAEGCSQGGDSVSEVDELDEQTMEALKNGSLPQSIETCIALNLVYQELLQAFMRHVEACLAQNREKQRSVEQELCSYTGEGGAKKRDSKVPVLQYIPPYFRDSAGLAPMKNADALKKAGELNVLVEPPKKWTDAEKKMLRTAIEEAIWQQRSASLENRRIFLKEELKIATDPEVLTSLTNEIKEIGKKIEAIKKGVDITQIDDKTFESIDWAQISISPFQGSRTAHECRQMWFCEMNPRLNQDPTWKAEEKAELARIAASHGYRNWKAIATELNTGRTAFQCFEKYQSELNQDLITKKKWTKEEDEKLREAVELCRQGDYIPFEEVANWIDGRTRAQCVVRWTRTLAPGLKRGPWAEDEDLLLLAAVEKCGPKEWANIAQYVPGRTDNQCRERWASTMMSGQRIGMWTPEEDEVLLEGIRQFGKGQWTKISQLLQGRNPASCKVRYATMTRQMATKGGLTAPYNTGQHRRARQGREQRDRVQAMYTRIVGHAPTLNAMPSVDNILSQLPEGARSIFREKLAAVHSRLTTGQSNQGNQGMIRTRKRTRQGRDMFEAILANEGEIPLRAQQSTRPEKELADIMKNSSALLPPTGCTLRGLRNLLSWHGADLLVESHYQRRLSNVTSDDSNGNQMSSDGREGNNDGNEIVRLPTDTQLYPHDLLPDDETTMSKFFELQETFEQLFVWPAILATTENEDD